MVAAPTERPTAGRVRLRPRRTGREIVAFFATLRGLHGLGRAAELAERFSADLDRSVGHLSRGNRQKIGLIQALFHAPELLIPRRADGRAGPAHAGAVPRGRGRGA
ncbi:MAG: hypothetical protein ACR2H2_13810 [Solirubrobacteraceae bacterium]